MVLLQSKTIGTFALVENIWSKFSALHIGHDGGTVMMVWAAAGQMVPWLATGLGLALLQPTWMEPQARHHGREQSWC